MRLRPRSVLALVPSLLCAAGGAARAQAPEAPDARAQAPAAPDPAAAARAEATFLAGMCSPDPVVATEALAKLDDVPKPSPRTEDAIVAALRGTDQDCRMQAAFALGRIRPARAVPALPLLRKALVSGDSLWQFQAAITLERMGRVGRAARADLEVAARSEDADVRQLATSVLQRQNSVAPLDGRLFEGLRLMALGTREKAPVGYLLDEDGFVFEVRGGEATMDGRIARITADALEFEGQRTREDFSLAPNAVRLRLFETEKPAPVPVKAAKHTGAPLSIDFAGDLASFASFLASFAPLNVVVEEGGGDAPIRVAAREVPWDAVVEHALASAGLDLRAEGLFVRVGRKEALALHPRLPERTYAGEPVSLQFREAEMETMGFIFGDVSGLEIELPPGPHAKVTIHCAEVPWDQALEAIAASRGWVTKREGERLRLTKAAP